MPVQLFFQGRGNTWLYVNTAVLLDGKDYIDFMINLL